MKKLLALFMALMMMVTVFTACGGDKDSNAEDSKTESKAESKEEEKDSKEEEKPAESKDEAPAESKPESRPDESKNEAPAESKPESRPDESKPEEDSIVGSWYRNDYEEIDGEEYEYVSVYEFLEDGTCVLSAVSVSDDYMGGVISATYDYEYNGDGKGNIDGDSVDFILGDDTLKITDGEESMLLFKYHGEYDEKLAHGSFEDMLCGKRWVSELANEAMTFNTDGTVAVELLDNTENNFTANYTFDNYIDYCVMDCDAGVAFNIYVIDENTIKAVNGDETYEYYAE